VCLAGLCWLQARAAMLTPAFELTQDCDFLTVAIRVPHARASEFDVYFEGVDFKFYAKPYFLRRVPAACVPLSFGSPRSRFTPRSRTQTLSRVSSLPPRRRLLPGSQSACRTITSCGIRGSRHRARGHPRGVSPVTLVLDLS
jgi:hypothetical protein